MIPRIKVTEENWKEFHGMECEFHDGDTEPKFGKLVGYSSDSKYNFIASNGGEAIVEGYMYCEIEDPCYVALSKHEGKRLCLNCWDEGEYFSPDEVEDGTLWGYDENGKRCGVDREYLSKLILWRVV